MRTFQIRLNVNNPWGQQIIQFLQSISLYYRSRVVKGAILQYMGAQPPPGSEVAFSKEVPGMNQAATSGGNHGDR